MWILSDTLSEELWRGRDQITGQAIKGGLFPFAYAVFELQFELKFLVNLLRLCCHVRGWGSVIRVQYPKDSFRLALL